MKVLIALSLLILPFTAHAAEIRVLSGNGARAAVSQLALQFEKASGHTVAVRFAVNVEVKRDIEGGVPFDAAILNPPVLDALIKAGKVAADSRTVIGRAGIGVGNREGAAKPDISTVAAFKKTLLSSKAVAYPAEGASGKYFVGLLERMGIAQEMQPRLKPMPAEYNVEVVASGEADLVVVVASRISGVRGVQLIGRIPDELQTWIGFTGGVSAAAKEPKAARDMLKFFTTPEAAKVLRATGVEPFVE
jgi:molybdate transport system substrate-binding protein